MAPPSDGDDDGGGHPVVDPIDVGDGGDDGGSSGGGGGGGGGVSGPLPGAGVPRQDGAEADWFDIAPQWVLDVGQYSDRLLQFLRKPWQFLKSVIVPVMLGAVFAAADSVAIAFGAPFEILVDALDTVTTGVIAAGRPIGEALLELVGRVAGITASFAGAAGPFQPFVAAAVIILAAYVLGRIAARTLQAAVSAIPVVGPALETLFTG